MVNYVSFTLTPDELANKLQILHTEESIALVVAVGFSPSTGMFQGVLRITSSNESKKV